MTTKDLPHHYRASAKAAPQGTVDLSSDGLPGLATAPPAEFGGPGDQWSPETLLVGCVADCFILTFRAVARASQIEWSELACDVEGVLDRADGRMRFTQIDLRARLRVPTGADPAKAERALQKAERGCLITNSLLAESSLETEIEIG